MGKLIDRIFKKLGYVPIKVMIPSKHITPEHTVQDYELICTRVKVPNERVDVRRVYTDRLIKEQIVRELSNYIFKYVDIKVIEEYDSDPYRNTFEGKVYISKYKK